VGLGSTGGGFQGVTVPGVQQTVAPAPGPGIASNAPITVGLSVLSNDQSGGEQSSDENGGDEAESDAESGNDTEQAKNEKENEVAAKRSEDKCSGRERLAWLTRGPHDTAHGVDWGQRQSVGTNPATTDDVLRRDECYFQEQASSGNAADAG
ncbi:MAG: hypothetical protein WAL83_11300, partial [Arenicellales bacterium]